jgi:hypothetical protein
MYQYDSSSSNTIPRATDTVAAGITSPTKNFVSTTTVGTWYYSLENVFGSFVDLAWKYLFYCPTVLGSSSQRYGPVLNFYQPKNKSKEFGEAPVEHWSTLRYYMSTKTAYTRWLDTRLQTDFSICGTKIPGDKYQRLWLTCSFRMRHVAFFLLIETLQILCAIMMR